MVDSPGSDENVDDEQYDELEKRRQDKASGRIRPGSKPRRLSSPERSGGQVPPRGRSTLVGGTYYDSYGFGLRSGQSVPAVVVQEEPGGYFVWVRHGERKLPGYLPTQHVLRKGEEIVATYVCVHKGRILLTARFGNSPKSASTEELQYENGPAIEWRFKRFLDIFPVTTHPLSIKKYEPGDSLIETLPEEFYRNEFSGVLKIQSSTLLSRAGLLFLRGRIVGCVHNSRSKPSCEPTEQSIPKAINVLKEEFAEVEQYELSREVAISMAALFLGYPVDRDDEYDAWHYFNYIFAWIQRKQQIACIVIAHASNQILALIHRGELDRSFHIQDQRYIDKSEVMEVLKEHPEADVQASILPPEFSINSKNRYGYPFWL